MARDESGLEQVPTSSTAAAIAVLTVSPPGRSLPGAPMRSGLRSRWAWAGSALVFMSLCVLPDTRSELLRSKLSRGLGHNSYGEQAWPNDLLYLFGFSFQAYSRP